MSTSALALNIAKRYPRLSRLTTRTWAEWYVRTGRDPHWLCRELVTGHQLRLKKRFRLPTGRSIFADPFDFLATEIRREGSYEPEVVGLFAAVARPGMVAFDVGANIGYHTIELSRIVGDAGVVVAFEPDPQTFRDLEMNVRANRAANVRCVNQAVGADAGTVPLYRGQSTLFSSLRPTVHAHDATAVATMDTLDRAVETLGLTHVDLIKVDVEGAELFALEGARDTLARWRPLLVVEVSTHTAGFGYSHAELTALMRRQGYALFEVGPFPMQVFRDEDLGDRVYMNVLAAPESSVQSLETAGIVDPAARRRA
jgi:FkbM family methyltransferase